MWGKCDFIETSKLVLMVLIRSCPVVWLEQGVCWPLVSWGLGVSGTLSAVDGIKNTMCIHLKQFSMDGQGTAWECENEIWIKIEQRRTKWSAVMTGVGFPGGVSGKETTCQCRSQETCRFDTWVGKMPWRKAWQTTPVFLPGDSQGTWRTTVHSVTKSLTGLKRLGTQHTMKAFLHGESYGRTEVPGRLQSMGSRESDTTSQLNHHHHHHHTMTSVNCNMSKAGKAVAINNANDCTRVCFKKI